MSELGALNPDDKSKLDNTVRTGITQLQEIDDIKGSLKDLVKHVSEELNIKPKDLNTAIRMAYKAAFADSKAAMSTVEDILDVTGYLG